VLFHPPAFGWEGVAFTTREAHTTGAAMLRVGAVNYLNTKPLIEGLIDFAPEIDLSLDLPSRLADQLQQTAAERRFFEVRCDPVR